MEESKQLSASHKFKFISLMLLLCCGNIPTASFLCLPFPILTFYSYHYNLVIVIYKNKFFANWFFGSDTCIFTLKFHSIQH